MGGSLSSGRDNDELVDLLTSSKYIQSPKVEAAFRAVDKGCYVMEGFTPKEIYCCDQSFRDFDNRHIHLSATSIYALAVEALELEQGISFLNVGSGTGYLSTIIGNLLGEGAVNHGIEVKPQAVHHSYNCLERYITQSVTFDATALAIPTFVLGNALQIDPGYRQYDRIYVGAGCSTKNREHLQKLLSSSGIMVMPCEDQLVKVKREGDIFHVEKLLPVSFMRLVSEEGEEEEGEEKEQQHIRIEAAVPSLQEMCRLKIYRQLGRHNLAKISELGLNPCLAEFVAFYRDPSLPSHRERIVYDTPLETDTSMEEDEYLPLFAGRFLSEDEVEEIEGAEHEEDSDEEDSENDTENDSDNESDSSEVDEEEMGELEEMEEMGEEGLVEIGQGEEEMG